MVLKFSAQGRKVMTSYITTVTAANAISVVSITASFILPVSGKRVSDIPRLLQIVLSTVRVGISRSLSQVLV